MLLFMLLLTMASSRGTQAYGGTLRAYSYTKTFSSPNYPSNYPNNLDTTWVINASPGHAIKLTFNPFYTEKCCDYVQIYDGSTSMGKFRGRQNNLIKTSKTNSVRILLHSDDSINGLGFSASYSEEDIDECLTGSHKCADNADCHNTEGSFVCSCKKGFIGNGTICTEINECNDAIHPPNCHAHAHCIDEVSTYRCECNDGYTGNGIQCADIDECLVDQMQCDDHASCNNRDGSFICTCDEGYSGTGIVCEDFDECAMKKHGCSFDSACQNIPGSYMCTCPSGYTGNGLQCVDVNECNLSPLICGDNARCVNRVGDYNCVCADGFAGDGKTCHKAFEVFCLPGSITVRVMRKYYTDKKIALQDLHLSDYSCKGTVDPHNPEIWVFNVTTLSSCSTIHMNNATHLLYTNTITNVLEGNHVYIGSAMMNTFSCTYKRLLDDLDLFSFNYGVYQDIANITAGSNLGVFIAKMNHYTDSSYSELERNQDYQTSDSIFVKIELETRDENLNLVLERCWVTPTPNMKRHLFYFINHGCAVNNSARIQITQSGRGPVARFNSQVFAFVDYNTTFLHCSLLVCPTTPGKSCEPKCVDGRNNNLNNHRPISDERLRFDLEASNINRKKRSAETSDEEILSMGPFRRRRNSSVFDFPLFSFFFASISILLIVCLILIGFLIRKNRNMSQSKALSAPPSIVST